jgi:hypothetical protein
MGLFVAEFAKARRGFKRFYTSPKKEDMKGSSINSCPKGYIC